MAPTAAAATMAASGLFAGGAFRRASRREGGKFLVQFAGTAMWAFRPGPVGGPHEDFAVAPALVTMEFVDWHGIKITGTVEILKRQRRLCAFK